MKCRGVAFDAFFNNKEQNKIALIPSLYTMVKICAVCKRIQNTASIDDQNRSYHRFPQDAELFDLWGQIIGRENASEHARICSDHFSINDVLIGPGGRRTLKKGAIPLIVYRQVDEMRSIVRDMSSNSRKCWVPTCLNPNLDPKKKSFSLPDDLQTREVWLALSGKTTESVPTEEIFFCQDHFSKQDITRMDENNPYHNMHKIFPSNYMPDRMCGTCMSLIPPEQPFHIVSSKFPSEMPPEVIGILSCLIPSKPEPLHQIFTFCMKDLKLPRDPPPIACNECYVNAWVYFVFKMTCIDAEKNLKGDMSWENYGAKVLCRSCPSLYGTNFLPLSGHIASLLQNMFIGYHPPPEVVPLKVCITCYNVLQRIEKFYKNCLEAEEKMKRHEALKKKYNLTDNNISSSSTLFTRSSTHTRVSGITIQSERGPMLGFPSEKLDDKIKIENDGSLRTTNTNVLLAQLMLEHGQSLKSDFYQEGIWSIICEKMQQQGVGCNVRGLMKVWKDMVQDTKARFDKKLPIGNCDKLVMEYHKTMQNVHTPARSVIKPSTTVSAADVPKIVTRQDEKEKSRSESPEKQIPVLEDESRPISRPKGQKKPIVVPAKIAAWSDEQKLEFAEIFEKEYIQFISKTEDIGKRRPWKSICTNIASGGYYTIKDDTFFHRLWMSMKNKSEEDPKSKPSPLTKKISSILKRDNIICSGKPIPLSNEEKIQLIKVANKHMSIVNGKWPPPLEYWETVTKDFSKLYPIHNMESIKRGYKNLLAKIKNRVDGSNPYDEVDKLMIKHLENHPGNYLKHYGYVAAQNTKQQKKADHVASAVTSSSINGKLDLNKTERTPSAVPTVSLSNRKPSNSKMNKKRGRSTDFDKPKLIAEVTRIFDTYSKQEIITLDNSVWTTIIKRICKENGDPENYMKTYNHFNSIRKAIRSGDTSNPLCVPVRNLLLKRERIIKKGAENIAETVVKGSCTSKEKIPNTTDTEVLHPETEISQPYIEISQLRHDVSQIGHDVSQPVHDVSQPGHDVSQPVHDVSQHVTELSQPEAVNNISKKRTSNEGGTPDPKRKKWAVMDPTAFNKLEPQQHDEILTLLASTYEKMVKANHQDLRWKSVIDKVYENGGYRDIPSKDFICLFNTMRSNLSEHKAMDAMTAFDKKLDGMLKKVRGVKKPEKKHHTNKYEKDYAYKPSSKKLAGAEGSKTKEAVPGSSNVDVSKRRKSASNVKFNLDEFYDIEDFEMALPPKKQNWSREEKMALISTVKAQGSAVFQLSKSNKVWTKILEEFQALGYNRSSASIHAYWSHLRKHAEMAWANQIQSTDVDELLIDFMTTAIREKTEPAAETSQTGDGSSGSDSDSRDKPPADDEVVDLTYDYVSFDDIERLSMESSAKIIKAERKEEGQNVDDIHNTKVVPNQDATFALTKVEGSFQYDMEDEELESSQPEFVTAEEIGLGNISIVIPKESSPTPIEEVDVDLVGENDQLSHIEYTYLDEEVEAEQEESVFEENGSAEAESMNVSES